MRILGEEVRLKENLGFSLKRNSIWWFALLITHPGLVIGVPGAKILQVSAVTVFVSLHQKLGNLFLFIVVFFDLWAVFVNTH